MGGTLEVNEEDVWMPAGWVFDNTVERVGNELLTHDRRLGEMFLQATTESSGGVLDLKSMTVDEMSLIFDALSSVHARTVEAGPRAFHDPAFYPGYVARLSELVEMMRRDRRLRDTE